MLNYAGSFKKQITKKQISNKHQILKPNKPKLYSLTLSYFL